MDRTAVSITAAACALLGALFLTSSASAQSSAALAPPSRLHFCGVFCSTWVWYQNRYVGEGIPHPEQNPQCGVTVERFTHESVVMHRTDCAPNPGKAVLTGRIAADGNSIVNGTIAWVWHPCCGTSTGTFQVTWGYLIDGIPGSGVAPKVYAPPFRAGTPTSPAQAPPAVAAQPAQPAPMIPAPGSAAATWPPQGQTLESGSATKGAVPLITTVPLAVKSCDKESASCTVWSWTGYGYSADAGTATETKLRLDQWNAASVHLQQSEGSSVGFSYVYNGRLQADGGVRGELSIFAPGVPVDGNAAPMSKSEWQLTILPSTPPAYTRCDFHDPANAQVQDARQRSDAAFHAGDTVTGVCWAHVGSLQGGRISESTYAYALRMGRGAAQDFPEAFLWAEKAAKQGQHEAMLNVADMYGNGTGVAQDSKKAEYWRGQAKIQEQLAQATRQTPDQFMMGLIQGYLEDVTGLLKQDHITCQQDARDGKPASMHCIDVEQRYQAGLEAARQRAYDKCLKTHDQPSDCRR